MIKGICRVNPAIAGGVMLSVALLLSPGVAQAQSGCEQGQKFVQERQGIIQRINGLGKKNVDPRRACPLFRSLAGNGERMIKWSTDNKDWCRVPDEFLGGLKAEHERIVGVRTQACNVAAKVEQAQRNARKQQQQQQQGAQSGLLGGGGVDPYSAPVRIPQGAL